MGENVWGKGVDLTQGEAAMVEDLQDFLLLFHTDYHPSQAQKGPALRRTRLRILHPRTTALRPSHKLRLTLLHSGHSLDVRLRLQRCQGAESKILTIQPLKQSSQTKILVIDIYLKQHHHKIYQRESGKR